MSNDFSPHLFVGSLETILSRASPDDFLLIVSESFLIGGFVYELRIVLRKYFKCETYTVPHVKNCYRI